MSRLLTHEVKVGIIVIVAAALFGVIAFKLREGIASREGYDITVIFPNTAGLAERSPVRLSGVKVGEVIGIYLRRDNRVEVTVRLRKGVRIPKEANFLITTQSILAFDKYIEVVVPKEPGLEYLEPGDTVHGLEPLQAQQIMESLYHSMATFENLSKTVSQLLDDRELMARIKEAMLNLSDATVELKSFVTAAAGLMKNRGSEIEQMISNLAVMSENGKEITYRLKKTLREGKIETLQSNLDELLEELSTTSKKASKLLDKINEQVLSEKNTESLSSIIQKGDEALSKFKSVQDNLKQIEMQVRIENGYRPSSHLVDTNAYIKLKNKRSGLFVQGGVMHIGEGSKLVLQGGKSAGNLDLYGGLKENKVGIGASWRDKKGVAFFNLYDPNNLKWELKGGYRLWDPLYLLAGIVKDSKRGGKELWLGVQVK